MNSRLILFLLISVFLFNCKPHQKETQKQTIDLPKNERLIYWEYGGPEEPYYFEAKKKISEKYGIHFETIGCVVNDSILNFIKTNNKDLFQKLQKKFPGFSEDEMLQEMQNHVTTQKMLEGILFRSDFMQSESLREILKSGQIYTRFQNLDSTKNEFEIDAFFVSKSNQDSLIGHFKINPQKGKVLKLSADGSWTEAAK